MLRPPTPRFLRFLDFLLASYSSNRGGGLAGSSISTVSASLLGSFATRYVFAARIPSLRTNSSPFLPYTFSSSHPGLTMSGFDRVRRVYGRQHRVPTRHLGIISSHRVAEYNERLSSSVFSLFEVHFLLTGPGPLSLTPIGP
jgi:hypothetical protein